MCIIIVQPEGHSFTDDQIEDFYDRNPHGWGFMWHEPRGRAVRSTSKAAPPRGRVQGVRTVPVDAKHAIELYRKYADGKAGVLHYRYATSGPVNTEMAHPFRVSDELLVVHNGVLPGGSKRESDTAEFVREVLVPTLEHDHKLLHDAGAKGKPGSRLCDELDAFVRGSAVVFLDSDGVITKLGRGGARDPLGGVEYKGCWYSNTYAWTLPPDLYGDDENEYLFDDDEELVYGDDGDELDVDDWLWTHDKAFSKPVKNPAKHARG